MVSILAIGIIAWWISEGCGIIQVVKWWLCYRKVYYKVDAFNVHQQRRLKPFDCPLCMGWWIGLFTTYYQTSDIMQSITYGILASACAILISKLMYKL